MQTPDQRPPAAKELFEFLDEPEPEYEWLIPDLLERGDRLIVTGCEGFGKSTLLRQMCLQTAAGIHPFTLDQMTPCRTMLLDLENPRRHLRRKIKELAYLAPIERGLVEIVSIPQGVNLLNPVHLEWLHTRIEAHQPALICAGPTYKMSLGDPKDEEQARGVAAALDHIRGLYGCTLILEAHQPYAAQGASRPERPYGASLWSRWPEFGLHLAKDGQLRHWRGERDERQWPKRLARGNPWPWQVSEPWEPPADWQGHTARQADCLKVLDQNPNVWLTGSQIAASVVGRRTVTVEALKELAADGRVDVKPGPGNSLLYRSRPPSFDTEF